MWENGKSLFNCMNLLEGSIINKLLWGRARRSRCIGKCLEANFECIREKNFWKVSFWWGVRMYENIQSRHYLAINKVLSLSACHYLPVTTTVTTMTQLNSQNSKIWVKPLKICSYLACMPSYTYSRLLNSHIEFRFWHHRKILRIAQLNSKTTSMKI